MQTNDPTLFVEINETNYIFVVGVNDDNQNLKIIEKITTKNNGIDQNIFINTNDAVNTIAENIEFLEKKLNFIFKEVIVIIDNFDYSCINVSGFKKLNGSQIFKENISYILNSLKLVISKNEEKKTILHIFNSRSVLDGKKIDNLPIGLFGDFYSHELTFFLLKNNDLKNIKQIFNKNNLNVQKVLIKSFSEGTQLINQNKVETFFKIKIYKDSSKIIFFDHSSFRYSENFKFGTNIILKDIEKVCSINKEFINNILTNGLFKNKIYNNDEFIEEKYFTKINYRKIRKKLIQEIVDARIDEIINIIITNNINIKSIDKKNIKIYLTIHDSLILENFQECLKSCFLKNNYSDLNFIEDIEIELLIKNTARLTAYGWIKEAIPIAQPKNSIITRIFKSIFR